MCVQDTYAEAWGEDRLEEVVQEAIQVPRGLGLTYGARGQSASSAWGAGLPAPLFPTSVNLSVPTPSLTCVAPAGQWWGWTWRGTWGQRGGLDARGRGDILSSAGDRGPAKPVPWLRGWVWGSHIQQDRDRRRLGTGVLGWHLQALGSNGVAVGTSWVPQVLGLADQVQHEVAASQVLPGVPGVQ